MSCKPDLGTTCEMWGFYQEGLSLAQVAALFKTTRQTVYERFKRRGLRMRSEAVRFGRPGLPFIEWGGARYAPNKDHYFRKTSGDRSLLHWDIWEKHNGAKVKRGWVVRFVDGDRMNLEPDNLESVPKGEDRRLMPIVLKRCRACAQLMVRRVTGNHPEGPKAYAKRQTCNARCAGLWKRGRPRWSRMSQ